MYETIITKRPHKLKAGQVIKHGGRCMYVLRTPNRYTFVGRDARLMDKIAHVFKRLGKWLAQ